MPSVFRVAFRFCSDKQSRQWSKSITVQSTEYGNYMSTHKATPYPDFYTRLPNKDVNNIWYKFQSDETVIVFVHGIFSDSRGCWLYEEGDVEKQYWPDLIATDKDFGNTSIFLGGFYTAIDAGGYDVSQGAQELFAALGRHIKPATCSVLEMKNIIFVCHSTGGIVTRYVLYHHADAFKNKKVGLVLIASPSFGSKTADKLAILASIYNNALGKQLQWAHSDLKELDRNFRNLVDERRIPNLLGIEAVENHFIVHPKWFPVFPEKLLVDEESAGRYFSAVRMLANTDHFGTVKPNNRTHPSYLLLLDFFTKFARVGRDQVINNIAPHSVEDLLAVLKALMPQLASNPEPDALDAMAVVLDEISKLYQLIDAELTRYLSLSFDDPQQVQRDRTVLLSLEGEQIRTRAKEARGHCAKISRIYSSRLRLWFQARLVLVPGAMDQVEHAFDNLADSDMEMLCAIDLLAQWLSQKGSQTLHLVDADDIAGARKLVKDARLDCQGMRQKLASTISTMRDIQAELLHLAP